ncbi:MAG: glycoside hydrolase family 2, partial [Chloroflexi bacterium]
MLSGGGPRPEYPRPKLRRPDWINLNGEWEFGAGSRPAFDRHIVVPFCAESQLSGIGEIPGDVVWYRRRFDAPKAERLALHFGAVDYRATVWVNDRELARHEGGHTPFSVDVTEALRARDNVLVVRAEDPLEDKTVPRGKQFWGRRPEGI